MRSLEVSVCLGALAAGAAVCMGEPPAVSQDRLMQTLRELPTRRAARGGDEDVKGLEATEALLVERLKALGYEPSIEPVRWSVPTHEDPRVWNNIYIEKKGIEIPGEVLIVGAHFDAVVGAPGADDNGTGTVAVLELARVLKDRPLKRTVRLVFFNLEEVGLIGSRAHAAALEPLVHPAKDAPPGAAAITIVGMVSLEMLGYFSDAPGSQRSPVNDIPGVFTSPTVGDFIAVVTVKGYQPFSQRLAAEMIKGAPDLKVLTLDFMPVPMPDMLRSDHAPFMALGVPAVMLTDSANFRNPNYHSARDTIGTIDAERFTAVVRGLAGAVEAIAEPAGSGSGAAGTDVQPAGRSPAP